MENIYNCILSKNIFSDKNTVHSYIPIYEQLFKDKEETAEYVLEVGIGDFHDKNGGSILLWSKYFKNAIVYGIDILPINRVHDDLINNSSIRLYTETDAYNKDFIYSNIDKKFDIIIDDGPHTLQSMIDFITLYTPLLKNDGILIIEDIPDPNWIDTLQSTTPDNLKKYIKVYDLRTNKDRYDDVLFVINKSTHSIL